MTDFADVRSDVVDYLRRQLVGPHGRDDEVIADTPNRRYLMGILFPRRVDFQSYVEQDGEQPEDVAGADVGEESIFSDDPVSVGNDFLPASQGLSFFTTATTVRVSVCAAHYTTLEGEEAAAALAPVSVGATEPTADGSSDHPRRPRTRAWRRNPLPVEHVSVGGNLSKRVFDGRGEIHVKWRPFGAGTLMTATLVNAAEGNEELDRMWGEMLLQVELSVRAEDGEILEYPSQDLTSHDDEEEELRLQYRDRKTYAVGHGCAVAWDAAAPVRELRTEVMPQFEVAPVRAAGQQGRALDLTWLADTSRGGDELADELTSFVEGYREWVRVQHDAAATLAPAARPAADRILRRLDEALARMADGAEVLRTDPEARLAFALANEVMRRQMEYSGPHLAGRRHTRSAAPALPEQYPSTARWRPFQLAFALVTLRGLVDASHPDRSLVDLIWFPTGGGKTEAYLLVAVFEIFRRRLVGGAAGGGTAVLSRYTLTLLTNQQFQRSATTVCAAERVRVENHARLGSEPISIGLWVGQSMTPNHYPDARKALDSLLEADQPGGTFVLDRCPWCGTGICPRERSEDRADYGIEATDRTFRFFCPSTTCDFHDALPVRVVDDDLYDHPPSFLLATVDKFAGLAWESRAGAFFGRTTGRVPPSLVIQDELHLLTGPLGTTVGLYETAVERLCESEGRLPKVVSSTATIRRAGDQVRGLFGRDVHLFPPSGLAADDSYFATAEPSGPGRLYVGIMAQGHTADTATVHSMSALLQAPVDLGLDGDAKDAYWTLVAYHSSLRELGRTVTIARDDVNARLEALVPSGAARVFDVEELTSNVERNAQPRLLERLGLPWTDDDCIDLVASTNMFSVGVDVPRLGLMLVNGQPKATAEYIQATSRVGRRQHPGLVVSLFRATRPRDRSHYENFRPYHAALYRFVEPTSVTPFSPPSRDRALHATLVILVRHHLGLAADATAGRITDNLLAVATYIDDIEAVIRTVEPREAVRARAELEAFVEQWVVRAREAERHGKALHYKPAGKGQYNLLKDFNRRGDAWPTPRSMRNVDRESLIDVSKAGSRSGRS